jgi:hypothetical protein
VNIRSLTILTLSTLGAISCTSGGGGGGGKAAFSLNFASQSTNIVIAHGSTLSISLQYQNSPDDTSVNVFADLDGDASTTEDQEQIQATLFIGGAGADLQTAELSWNTSGAVSGTYTLMAQDTVGSGDEIRAGGLVTVNHLPTLTLISPAFDFELSRGMSFDIHYSDNDLDDPTATTQFFADEDGDWETTADQHTLTPQRTQGAGSGQVVAADTSTLPAGNYALLGVTDDSIHDPLVVQSAGELMVSNAAWARGIIDGTAHAMAAMDDGGTVVVGEFIGSAVFGAGETGETTLMGDGSGELFLARYDSDGSLVWARQAGGSGLAAVALDVTVGNNNVIVICGSCQAGCIFGEGESEETIVAGTGGLEAFVARYESDGNLEWVKVCSGAGEDQATGISIQLDGSVSVSGYYNDAAVFGVGEVNEITLPADVSDSPFVARFIPTGLLAWAYKLPSTALGAKGVDVQALSEGTYVALSVPNTPGGVGHMTRVSPIGNQVWSISIPAMLLACAADSDNSVLVTGSFTGDITLGIGEENETSLSSAGTDMFLARFSSNRKLSWAIQSNASSGVVYGSGVSVSNDGTVIISGDVSGEATFGLDEATETEIMATNLRPDLARHAGDGGLIWVVAPNTSQGSAAHLGVSIHSDGSAFGTGTMTGLVTFGEGEVEETTLSQDGSFVYRINADGEF